MKICMIHGQNHVGTTCRIGRGVARALGGEVTEFFLPRDFGDFCVGCGNCFTKSEDKCPHFQKLRTITGAMDAADVLIFTSPVYVYHVTGAMKAFLDHYGWQWLIHRPKPAYFHKQAVLIATAAGGGTKSALHDMTDSMYYWGVPRVYKMSFNVHALTPGGVDDRTKKMINREIARTAARVRADAGRGRGLTPKQRALFEVMRKLHKKGVFPDIDNNYWREQGWI